MTSPTKKPKFLHIAINGKDAKTGTKYVKDLAAAMNKLNADGYSIQLNEMKHFTVLMGVLPEEQPMPSEHPIMRIMRLLDAVPESTETPEYSPRTQELLVRFDNAVRGHGGADAFISEMQKQVAALTKGFTTEELGIAVKEVEAVRAAHEKEHDSPNCGHSRVLAAIAEALRATVTSQLQ